MLERVFAVLVERSHFELIKCRSNFGLPLNLEGSVCDSHHSLLVVEIKAGNGHIVGPVTENKIELTIPTEHKGCQDGLVDCQ